MLPRRALALLLTAPLLATACGGDDQPNTTLATPRSSASASVSSTPADSASPSATADDSASPTASSSASATADDTASATASGTADAAGGAEIMGTISNKYTPAVLKVKVGDEVTWVNDKAGFHTVSGGDGKPDPASPIGENAFTDGTKVKKTFTKAGTYKYFCTPHVTLGMKGEIVVS